MAERWGLLCPVQVHSVPPRVVWSLAGSNTKGDGRGGPILIILSNHKCLGSLVGQILRREEEEENDLPFLLISLSACQKPDIATNFSFCNEGNF